jgi:tellurite resistance-related uncharacterized protein
MHMQKGSVKNLPDDVVLYKTTPEFNQETIPAGFRRDHKTAVNTWARIVVHEGSLRYVIELPHKDEYIIVPGRPGIVEPQCPHHVEITGVVRFSVEFYH